MFKITTCPSCGSSKIRRIRGDSTREYDGISYVVPDLEYYECPDCGERLYDRDAMQYRRVVWILRCEQKGTVERRV